MKKILTILFAAFLFASTVTTAFAAEEKNVYHCDYKVIALKTNIEVTKNDDKIGDISGKVIRLITDPLTFINSNGDVVGQASDTYAFIAQDSHGIIVGDTLEVVMAGKFKLFGEKYELLNADGEKIGMATFNLFRTSGKIVDNDGNVCATYSSPMLFYDYDVEILNDTFSDEAVLLMVASYMSDVVTDARTSGSSSSKSK